MKPAPWLKRRLVFVLEHRDQGTEHRLIQISLCSVPCALILPSLYQPQLTSPLFYDISGTRILRTFHRVERDLAQCRVAKKRFRRRLKQRRNT